jgi:hypothetical protein
VPSPGEFIHSFRTSAVLQKPQGDSRLAARRQKNGGEILQGSSASGSKVTATALIHRLRMLPNVLDRLSCSERPDSMRAAGAEGAETAVDL